MRPPLVKIFLFALVPGIIGGGIFLWRGRQEESSAPAANVIFDSIRTCEKEAIDREFMASSRYHCYLKTLREGIEKHGLAFTSQAFERYMRQERGEALRGACHSWSHELGETAVRNGYETKDIFSHCSSECLDGCFNGAGHAFIALHKDLAGVNEFCSFSGDSANQKKVDACFHGVGHGLTDVFGAEALARVDRCDAIRYPEGRAQCAHAIFMLFNGLPFTRVVTSYIPADMRSFCGGLASDYQGYCWDYAGYLTYGKTRDIEATIATCRGVPDTHRKECYRRVGDNVYLASAEKSNVGLTIAPCEKTTLPEARFWCKVGIAKILITDANVAPEKSFEICASLDPAEETPCYRVLGEYIETYRSKDNRMTLCGALEPHIAAVCRGGA